MKVKLMNAKTCGEYIYLNTDEGKPYRCVIKDIYHFYEEDHPACQKFVERDSNDE